ncbi:MAG TPA: polyprenol monophosphomannose synthase [Phycisphaerae bacterium]|jgi:dolichol-phosphate mannosyltransferase
MPAMPPRISVIVPTYREASNLAEVTRRVFAGTRSAAGGLEAELIFVDDDSRDGSVEIVQELAREYAVRIMVREGERGLSSAVLAGFEAAQFDVLAVMDADLQHPPEKLPALVAPIVAGTADFVIGSRYVDAATVAQRWPWYRRLNSRIATLLAAPLVQVRDPMSGFFALHRRTLQRARDLNPVGYKIALELMVKASGPGSAGRLRCLEVPIVFAERHAGQSKLTFRVQMRYLAHLAQLYWFRYV